MKQYCITFRSVTPAQRGQRLLRGKGVECMLMRTPRWMEERGCGYCLKLSGDWVRTAVAALREGNLVYSKLYAEENGVVTEINL